MKIIGLTLSLVSIFALAGCLSDTENAATTVQATIAQQVANATCSNPIPDRDNWLRKERPSIAEVKASYAKRGIDPEVSGVFRAYRAFMESGQNHDAAGAVYGDGYPALAACFS